MSVAEVHGTPLPKFGGQASTFESLLASAEPLGEKNEMIWRILVAVAVASVASVGLMGLPQSGASQVTAGATIVKHDGVSCDDMKGGVKFNPPLTGGTFAPITISVFLKGTDCTMEKSTGAVVESEKIKGVLSTTERSDCLESAFEIPGTLTITLVRCRRVSRRSHLLCFHSSTFIGLGHRVDFEAVQANKVSGSFASSGKGSPNGFSANTNFDPEPVPVLPNGAHSSSPQPQRVP